MLTSPTRRWFAPQWPGAVLLVVVAALLLRVWSAWQSGIVNQDAAVYIHQARALHYGEWSQLGSGSMGYLSPYPALIAVFNLFAGDWIVAARLVSITFSVLTLMVFYPLARTFFARDISLLLLLIYAFNPLFVSSGVDVVKDPASWFFVVAGMLAFVKGLGAFRPILLSGSGLLFLLAASMRVETLVFLAGSALYLLIAGGGGRWKKLLCFLAPLLAAVLLGLATLALTQRSSVLWARLGEIGPRLEMSLDGYQSLREGLRALSGDPPAGMPSEYFDQVRSITWLVGLGAILRNAIEAYYAPFFALFVVGLIRSRGGFRGDTRARYFLLLLALLGLLFYVFIFSFWVLEQRWLGTAVLASFFFTGQGLMGIRDFALSKLRFAPKAAGAALAALIVMLALPKTILPREQDKTVFLEISAAIVSGRTSAGEIDILAPTHAIRWVSLYANEEVEGAPYPDEYVYDKRNRGLVADNYEAFIDNLRTHKVSYVLWAEKQWPRGAFDLLSFCQKGGLEKTGEWEHPDTGKMVLFKVGVSQPVPIQ
jgi:4-amino-4-deoxy-L-arabinose transferase-like glycosyltransferase